MAFQVRSKRAAAGDREGEVYELVNDEQTVRAEVWPQWGFNCLKWQVRAKSGEWQDILFHMPDWQSNPVPTRSGQPILFPFPGRLREGKMTFEGKEYQLPLTDNTKMHAIHGFTPRNRWRVADFNGDDDFAFITGEFNLKKDLPDALPAWPADFLFSLTYRLFQHKLRVDARVVNLSAGGLPFGLGFHGYFRLPGVTDELVDNYLLQANVKELWLAENSFPTGWRSELPKELDFRKARPIGAAALDNGFTEIDSPAAPNSELLDLAALSHPDALGTLRVLGDHSFRDLVLFTPQHRKAIAIEPYTCSADAANLWSRGIDSGWRVLEPGAEWEGIVEYHWNVAAG